MTHCATDGGFHGTLAHAGIGRAAGRRRTLGLRERNKLRTRQEIADATLRLAAERGLEHVTVEQIAAAADIAPRTFFRYFDSKEDAAPRRPLGPARAPARTLRDRPAAEGPLTAVRAAILEVVGDLEEHRDLMLCKVRLTEANPPCGPRAWSAWATWSARSPRRSRPAPGVDLDADFRPFVIAGAVCSAMRVAIDRWGASGGQGDLTAMVQQALDLLDGGLDHSI